MRRLTPLLAVVLLAVTPAAASAKARDRCALPRGATLVAQSPSLEVQLQRQDDAGLWTACRRSTGRRLVLLRAPGLLSDLGSLEAVDFRLAGRFVVFGRQYARRGEADTTLVRADTAGVGRVEELGSYGPRTLSDAELTSLQVTSRGVVLFVADSQYDYDVGRGPTSRIGVADGAGFRLLEVTALGAITRPALTGTTATWATGGVARSVALTPR